MKKNLLILAIMFTAVALFSCKKASPDPAADPNSSNQSNNGPVLGRNGNGGECPSTVVTLKAGQTIDAGTISATNDADFIYVTYTTANDWLLTQTHLYVGDCELVPINNSGNPMPGQFPYSTAHNYETSYNYTIPISAIPAGNCGCIAAHAVVVQLNASGQVIATQTGWGNGVRINPNGNNWGMKFDYCSCSL